MTAHSPMRIQLDEDRRGRMIRAILGFAADRFDLELRPFQAEQLLDFFVLELGAPVYNQAIADAHGFLPEKLVDLQGEFYEPETSASR